MEHQHAAKMHLYLDSWTELVNAHKLFLHKAPPCTIWVTCENHKVSRPFLVLHRQFMLKHRAVLPLTSCDRGDAKLKGHITRLSWDECPLATPRQMSNFHDVMPLWYELFTFCIKFLHKLRYSELSRRFMHRSLCRLTNYCKTPVIKTLLHAKNHLIKQVTNANYNWVSGLFFFAEIKFALMQLQHYIVNVAFKSMCSGSVSSRGQRIYYYALNSPSGTKTTCRVWTVCRKKKAGSLSLHHTRGFIKAPRGIHWRKDTFEEFHFFFLIWK